MNAKHILAIDQGTSSTKCILVDDRGRIVAKAQAPLGETYPQSGWVEQDAEAIWRSVCRVPRTSSTMPSGPLGENRTSPTPRQQISKLY